MKRLTRALVATAFTSSLAVPSLAHHEQSQSQSGMPGKMDPAMMQQMMQRMMPAPSDPASTKEFKEAQMKMMQTMHSEYTGNVGVDFRNSMIPHHQGAIEMAKVALKYSKDTETKALAENIIQAQEKEIADMQAWLKKNKSK